MFKTDLQEKKSQDWIKICHPHSKEPISLKVEEVASALLSQCQEEDNFHPRYSLCLGNHLITERNLEKIFLGSDPTSGVSQEKHSRESIEYLLKVEKSIAKALSALLQITPPLEDLKEFGVHFEKARSLDNHRVAMTYTLENAPSLEFILTDFQADGLPETTQTPTFRSRLFPFLDMQQVLNSLLKITRGDSVDGLERLSHPGEKLSFQDFREIEGIIEENSPPYEEVFYFANALFYEVDNDPISWIQRFLKNLKETQNDSPLIHYLRELLQPYSPIPFLSLKHTSPIPLEEIPSLLKGAFLLFAQNIQPKSTLHGMKLQCKFPLGPCSRYVDIPDINARDLEIQEKYLDKKSFREITEILNSKVRKLHAKYLGRENLSLEEFKWALQKADFKNKTLVFTPEEKRNILSNIEQHSSFCFDSTLAERLGEIAASIFPESSTKLICGTIRRWIHEHPSQLHAVSSTTWDFLARAALAIPDFGTPMTPWNYLLQELTGALVRLPNQGLANFLKMLLHNKYCKVSQTNLTRALMWNDRDASMSAGSLCRFYKDLYQIPEIATVIESNYLISCNALPAIFNEEEKKELQSAIRDRLPVYFNQQKISEAFVLLKHRYALFKDQSLIARDLTELFLEFMHQEEARIQFISCVLRYFPDQVGHILENLKTNPKVESLWIKTLAGQDAPTPFTLRKQCLLRILDRNTNNSPNNQLLEKLSNRLSRDEALILMKECVSRASNLSQAKIDFVFKQALEAVPDLHISFHEEKLDLLWLQNFFTLLKRTNNITEDRLEFLCSHVKNHSLIDAQSLITSMIPECTGNAKAALVYCVQFQVEKMLALTAEEENKDLLFSCWESLFQEPLYSLILEAPTLEDKTGNHFPYRATCLEEFVFFRETRFRDKSMKETLQECFTLIANNLEEYVRKRKSNGVCLLQKYMQHASLEERSLLAQNSMIKLSYHYYDALALFHSAVPLAKVAGDQTHEGNGFVPSLRELIPFWRENSWNTDQLQRGFILLRDFPILQREFTEHIVDSMDGYPVNLLQQIGPFLSQNAKDLMHNKVRKEIESFNPDAQEDPKYLTLLENFLVTITLPEFEFLLGAVDTYQSVFQMAWWLLRQLDYDDRLTLFFKSFFKMAFHEKEVPKEKKDEIDLLRMSVALDCAADVRLSKSKEDQLITALLSCSESVLKELSKSITMNMKIKSQIIFIKALERKCQNCRNSENFPNETILSILEEQLDSISNDLTPELFKENRSIFHSLAQSLKELRLHPSKYVGACAGYLALLFLYNDPLKENLQAANELVRDVLQFRLELGAKLYGFNMGSHSPEVESAFVSFPQGLYLDTVNDLTMYFRFFQEIHCGCNSEQIEKILLANPQFMASQLEINRSLIRKWIELLGTIHTDPEIQRGVVQEITRNMQNVMDDKPDLNQCFYLAILAIDLLLDSNKTPRSAQKLDAFFSYLWSKSYTSAEYLIVLELYQRFLDKWVYNQEGSALLEDNFEKILKGFTEKAASYCLNMSKIKNQEDLNIVYNSIALMCASYLQPRHRINEYSLKVPLRRLIENNADHLIPLAHRVQELIKYPTANERVKMKYCTGILDTFKAQLTETWEPTDVEGHAKKESLLRQLENLREDT